MASSANEIDQLFWTLGANSAPLVAGVGRAQRSLQGLSKSVLSVKGGLVAVGAAGALAFIKATNAAAKLDKPLREVSTLLPQTVEDMANLREEIIALSTRVPQPPEQLTRGLYQVISAGVTDTADAMNLLEVAAMAATAGLSTSQDAVLAITTVLNAFQLEASESARISDVFFKTIAQGVITFPEIAGSIGDMATTAAQAGVSVEEMSAALAAMTKAGISASEATTSLNRLFLEIVEGSIGEGFDLAAVKAEGFAAVMNKVAQTTGGDVKALQELIPELRAFRAASVIAGNQNGEFNRILGEMGESAGATKTAFDKMSGSLQDQWELMKNRLGAFWLEFGTVTLPIVIAAVKTLNNLLGAQAPFDATALSAAELESELDRVALALNTVRNEIDDLHTPQGSARARVRAGELIERARIEEERLADEQRRLIAERERRRAAAARGDLVGGAAGGGGISDEIQALRDQLAVQLQDELVAITASSVDDMELEFQRLRDTIVEAFGEIPDEWRVVLDHMRDDIEDTLGAEVRAAVDKLGDDLGKLRGRFGSARVPVKELGVDVDALTDNVIFLTRAFAELGQGFGVFGRGAGSALNSISSITQGVQALSALETLTASAAAGPVGLIAGGIASLAGLAFGGPSAFEQERMRTLKANNEALERLTATVAASATKGSTEPGLVSAGIAGLRAGLGVRSSSIRDLVVSRQQALTDTLAASGFTMLELMDLAESMGITLDATHASWTALLDALQSVEAAGIFDGFAGGLRQMRIEWELTDTIDPAKKLKRAREEFERLAGVAAPKNADEILAFFNQIKSGDLSGLGKLSPNDLIEFLQLLEGLMDETATASGTTQSFAVSRTITEVTGNRLAGLLATGNFWAEQTALNTAGILDALGGSQGTLAPPTAVSVLNPTDITIVVSGARDPQETAFAVREELVDNFDRAIHDRLRDTRRARGRRQTDAFRN